MTYPSDRDQAQRLKQDEAIEELYLEGIGGGFDRRLLMRNNLVYGFVTYAEKVIQNSGEDMTDA